jgi:segregation and condensation protein B
MLKEKEKEQQEKMKALRRELEEKLEEQLPPEMLQDERTRVEVQRINESEPLDPEKAKRVLEALLFASSKPIMVQEIRKVMKSLSVKDVEGLVAQLKEEYARDNRSFELLEVAGGFEIATRKEYAPWIFKIEMHKKAKQVTQSALETLSILAYKQPITRAEIEELRGVDASGVVNTLIERNLIKIVGKKEVPGRPFLYGTTDKFLEHFGLKSLQDLPNIDEIKNLVEKSVKRDELLGRTNIVDVPQEEQAPSEGEAPAASHSEEGQRPDEESSEILRSAQDDKKESDESPAAAQ